MDILDLEFASDAAEDILDDVDERDEVEVIKEPQPGIPFMLAGSKTCRTIIGHDDEGVLFCETPAPLGQSWCPACRSRYYVPARRMTVRIPRS